MFVNGAAPMPEDSYFDDGDVTRLLALPPVSDKRASGSDVVAGTTPSLPTLVDRARAIRERGPDVRLPTGLATLDANCRGGLAVHRVVVVGGAPSAGKTALVVWLLWSWARTGIPCAMLAVDEAADDIVMRIALLEGFGIEKLEARDPEEWEAFEARLEELPLLVVDGDEDARTLEDVAAELLRMSEGKPAALAGDSLQLMSVAGIEAAKDLRERVNLAVRACKQIAKTYPFVVLATSELARGAYRSTAQAENINPLAAFKESGGIEYGAQTAIVLRSVPGGEGRVVVDIPKNRGGRKEPFHVEIDGRTRLREVTPPSDEVERPDHVSQDATTLRTLLVERPGLQGFRELRGELKSRGITMSNGRLDAAVARLGVEIERRREGREVRWYLRQEAST